MLLSALSLALREIRHNPMRSGLTALGIIIGVSAVICLVTLGNGATARVTSDIASLGTNLLLISPGIDDGSGPPVLAEAFKNGDAEAILAEVSGIAALSPAVNHAASAVYGNETYLTTITGSNNAYFETRNYKLGSGRKFTTAELGAGKSVCIIGETVREELFGRQTPIGAKIRLGTVSCEVVGLVAEKGASAFGGDQDDFVLAPMRMVQRRLIGNRDVSFLFVSTQSENVSAQVQEGIKTVLRERRHIRVGDEDDFTIYDMKQIISILETTTTVLTALLGAIAGISLIVGGIGIMNIMLVSVTERTREIGIRLAVGALERDVLVQFLIEAIVLSMLGGILGVILGLIVSFFIAIGLDVPFTVSIPVILLSLGFSAFVGIVFGFFPARRAARLDPIDALRYE